VTNAGLDPAVLDELQQRGVRHLTHFSASRNLPHILAEGGLLSVDALREANISYEPTDPSRFDKRTDAICCNIDLPNTRYFQVAKGKINAYNFPDWVILLLKPALAARPGTGFAPGNAARKSGREIRSGAEALADLWADEAAEARRRPGHRTASPTNTQAEVLIPGRIDLADILAVVLPSAVRVREERARLHQLGHDPDRLTWRISRGMFLSDTVTSAIHTGSKVGMATWTDRPEETPA
jgi:hypothetical protein